MPLLITAGEPAGIGPDIVIDTLHHRHDRQQLLVIADAGMLEQRAARLGIPAAFHVMTELKPGASLSDSAINVLHTPLRAACTPGQLDRRNSPYVLDTLDTAEQLCRNGLASALVTAPVHKGIINDAGLAFSGHTEYLAAASNSRPVMMLATGSLRVALATTHLPLREVADAITQPVLSDVIKTLHHFLQQRCHIARPAILVCGLNPHAGEDGHLGHEEQQVIEPVLNRLRAEGIHCTGPLPADTLFTEHHLPQADAVLAMYHDQGLPVLKYSGFGSAVNITLGLPFIRTSVDHGTALELAATGKAGNSSLVAAIDMAKQLCE